MPRYFLALALLLGTLGWSPPVESQSDAEGWTARPDARAPAGIRGDALLAPGTFEASYRMENGQVWMAYRFTDWVSASARISYRKTGNLSGSDTTLDPFSSPLGHPNLQSGTQVAVPIGMNLRFPEGRLEGSRIGLELMVPLHQDLDGPQLTPNSGVGITWGIGF